MAYTCIVANNLSLHTFQLLTRANHMLKPEVRVGQSTKISHCRLKQRDWMVSYMWLTHSDTCKSHTLLHSTDDFLTLLMPILCRSSVPSKWKLFGVLLKVPPSSLDNIEAKHPHNPQQGLMEMLELWQKRVNPPPSWDIVIEALQDLDEEQLATKLADKYKPQD